MNRIAAEVVEASRATWGKHVTPSFSNELISIAKRLQRLQSRRRTLRKALKQTETDIKRAKHELKALAHAIQRNE